MASTAKFVFFGMMGGADCVWCKDVCVSLFIEGLGRYSRLPPPKLRTSN